MASGTLTVSLPEDLIEFARSEVARRGGSLDALVREVLEEKLGQRERSRRAGERLLALAAEGPLTSIDPGAITHDELHERR